LEFICEAYESVSLDYNVDAAVEWGDNLRFPDDVFNDGVEESRKFDFDLVGMISGQEGPLPDTPGTCRWNPGHHRS
jgi:hypothetical protein